MFADYTLGMEQAKQAAQAQKFSIYFPGLFV
jgi:hypothetical protein